MQLYLWVKAFHIVFVVTWFAALFYLPRLFVYHAASTDETSRERFKIMERKLYHGIMTPSAVFVVLLGGTMLALPAGRPWLQMGWLHAKIALVVLLIGYHLYCGVLLRRFRDDRNQRGHVWYRWFNEAPVLVLVAVVLLVVLKPF